MRYSASLLGTDALKAVVALPLPPLFYVFSTTSPAQAALDAGHLTFSIRY